MPRVSSDGQIVWSNRRIFILLGMVQGGGHITGAREGPTKRLVRVWYERWHDKSKYEPHQGARERARRLSK